MRIPRILLLLGLSMFACVALAATPPLPAFTAHYKLLRNGDAIGTATVTLTPGKGDTWVFTTKSHGTSGLASLLGAKVDETSRFRWVDGLPQGESYRYSLHSAVKNQHREVNFDWADHTIEVNDNGTFRYPTRPGTLDKHTVVLALAAGLAAGKHDFTLPVAVRNRVQMQHYAASPARNVKVPAGSFDATKVVRSGKANRFTAWFDPAKLPAPIKVDHNGKSEFTLELESWSRNR